MEITLQADEKILKWEEASSVYGDEAGLIVHGLFSLDGIFLEKRILTSRLNDWTSISHFEKWVLENVGLSEWTAPNLWVKFLLNEYHDFVIAQIEQESEIVLEQDGKIAWLIKQEKHYINSSLTNFFKCLIVYSEFVTQVQLVRGSDAMVNKNIPIYLLASFSTLINEIDPAKADCWLNLCEMSA